MESCHSEIPRGKGVLKAKILEAKCEAKLEFPGGRGGGGGCKTLKKPSVESVWIFSGTARCRLQNNCQWLLVHSQWAFFYHVTTDSQTSTNAHLPWALLCKQTLGRVLSYIETPHF